MTGVFFPPTSVQRLTAGYPRGRVHSGGGGSGKGFIGGKAFGGRGPKVINSDEQFERLMKASELSLKTDVGTTHLQKSIRPRAKELTEAVLT